MNTYVKYYPNVWLAKCEAEHAKGDIIEMATRYQRKVEVVVHNLVVKGRDGFFYYSIVRLDGYNSQERAKNKAERLEGAAVNATLKGEAYYEKSKEGKDFLALAEPIKVGHHSEKRHRALIERNWKRTENAFKAFEKADEYKARVAYWDNLSTKIDLSMPESLGFFDEQLEEAVGYHKYLKDNPSERAHSMSLSYASKKVKELTKKCEIAKKLWG